MYIFSCISGRLGFFNVHTTFLRAKTLSLVTHCRCHVTDAGFLDTTTSRDSTRAGFRNPALVESSSRRFVALQTGREGEFPPHTRRLLGAVANGIRSAPTFFLLYYKDRSTRDEEGHASSQISTKRGGSLLIHGTGKLSGGRICPPHIFPVVEGYAVVDAAF
jgi:hypothetical protein